MAINRGQLTIFRCAFCGELMTDGRKDKKTCSVKCRMRLSRWRSKVYRLEDNAHKAIDLLEQYLKFYDALPIATGALTAIQDRAKAALQNNRIQAVK